MAKKFYPPSLLNYFEPPEGYIGSFAKLCSYSADSDFLNAMMEIFTGKSKSVRANEGIVNALLLLDKGSQQIAFSQVPGLYHSARKAEQPFKLMHAKLAILHFRNNEKPERFLIRLIVSTGNFTTETLKNNLDLIFHVDLKSETLRAEPCIQSRADIVCAKDFMNWLGSFYNLELLDKNKDNEINEIISRFNNDLERITKPKNAISRFKHNRENSLLKQLVSKVAALKKGAARRNYLAIGSGFYQKSAKEGDVPSVISNIENSLRESQLITQNCFKDLYVNEKNCQAVASSADAIRGNSWIIRPTYDPLDLKFARDLHAKFIFSANYNEKSDTFSNSWLYLGSGNMTEAGFTNAANKKTGNLEVGMVISTQNLFCKHNSRLNPTDCLNQLLPLQWDKEFNSEDTLHKGSEFIESPIDFFAPPVSWFQWQEVNTIGLLIPSEVTDTDYVVLNPNNIGCEKNAQGAWLWPYDQPAEIMVTWGNKNQYIGSVPIIDNFGKIARKKLSQDLSLSEALWLLEGFPSTYTNNEESDGEEMQEGLGYNFTRANTLTIEKYPIRAMMELIEKIADKQTQIKKEYWKTWCSRLEQSLYQTTNNKTYDIFRQMNINPLSPLLEDAFRPDYTLKNNPSFDKNSTDCYEKMVKRLFVNLKLIHLEPI